jgi:hypothetical protein
MQNKWTLFLLMLLIAAACNKAGNSKSKDNAEIVTDEFEGTYFRNLKDGESLKSPVIVQMGVIGMEVEPAGSINEGKGHHHIIIDGGFIAEGEMVPADETHLHFGKGQVIDTLSLTPGKHTLTLQFANGAHQSYGKNWSKTIEITVVE